MPLQDAIQRRIGKQEELKQRQIATGDFSFGRQFSDPYREDRLAALSQPQITDANTAIGDRFALPPLEFKLPPPVQPIQLPSVNITMPTLDLPKQPTQGPAKEEAPKPQQQQYSGGGGDNIPRPGPDPEFASGLTRSGNHYNASYSNGATMGYHQNGGYFNNSPLIRNQSGYLSESTLSSAPGGGNSGGGYSSFSAGPY